MVEHKVPTSTQELPTANIEGFAEFIMKERGGFFTVDHLEAIFGTVYQDLVERDIFPRPEYLTELGTEHYKGKVLQASENIRALFLASLEDDAGEGAKPGAKGVKHESREDLEKFIEGYANEFTRILLNESKEEK